MYVRVPSGQGLIRHAHLVGGGGLQRRRGGGGAERREELDLGPEARDVVSGAEEQAPRGRVLPAGHQPPQLPHLPSERRPRRRRPPPPPTAAPTLLLPAPLHYLLQYYVPLPCHVAASVQAGIYRGGAHACM
jgi:hypothetical protein